MNNLLDILNKSVNYLEKKGIKNARLTAESIISEVMKMERIMLYAEFERILSEDELKKIRGKLNEVVNKLKEKKGTRALVFTKTEYGLRTWSKR